MAANIFVVTRTALFPGGVAVPDVHVGLYTTQGAFLTSGVTDVNGSVFLGNRAAGTYEIRITPPQSGQVVGGTLQSVTVVGVDPNTFDVVIETSGLPVAVDAAFCRCSGYFVTSHGNPAAGIALHFKEGSFPVLLYAAGAKTTRVVVPEEKVLRTDSKGYVSIDLLRDAVYSVLVGGYDNVFREIKVPDASSAPLVDVLFPTIARVEYKDGDTTLSPTDAPTITLSIPTTKTLKVFTVWRSGAKVAGMSSALSLNFDDQAILDATLTGDTLVLKTKDTPNVTATIKVALKDAAAHGIPVAPSGTIPGGTLTISIL